jgi:hypothetical protein
VLDRLTNILLIRDSSTIQPSTLNRITKIFQKISLLPNQESFVQNYLRTKMQESLQKFVNKPGVTITSPISTSHGQIETANRQMKSSLIEDTDDERQGTLDHIEKEERV